MLLHYVWVGRGGHAIAPLGVKACPRSHGTCLIFESAPLGQQTLFTAMALNMFKAFIIFAFTRKTVLLSFET